MEFSDWITNKYVEWRGNAIGNERTITDFAEMVGVSQSLMTQWMRPGGKKPRNQTTVTKLVSFFGAEVYDVLDLPRPEQHLIDYQRMTSGLSDAERELLRKKLRQWLTDMGVTWE
jgi:hypothetical protein